MTPQFITFTGADDSTSISEMQALEADYRGKIEWGILWSRGRAGRPRYPTSETFDRFVDHGLSCSAHICGDDAHVIALWGDNRDLLINDFRRAQINLRGRPMISRIEKWAAANALRAILQCRDEFPNEPKVDWLYDPSGGRGSEPSTWPAPTRKDVLVGYAGGLRPGFDWKKISDAADGAPYWLDMETGVRNEHDEFDLKACRQVLREVYG